MVPDFCRAATIPVASTPLGAAGRGIAGGLAGTLLLSVFARVLPALRSERMVIGFGYPAGSSPPTLARALTVAQSPGPEGLAEQFAFKVAAGLFGRDIGAQTRLVGVVVHLAYGAAWGMLYGLIQATYRRPPAPSGVIYGVAVWLIGPALLVPAMRLMGRPSAEPPARTASLVVGHLAYGLALAITFDALQRPRR